MSPPVPDIYIANRPKSMRPISIVKPPRSKACQIIRPYDPPTRKHEKPSTPFSGSLLTPEFRKTNTQLVEDLKSAPGVDESKLKSRVAFAIHEDANDDPVREPASLVPGKDDWEVHGGRLGRDHTLEDVPNHYLRDRLMSFTNDCMPKDQAPEARRRVFSDLNEGEIAAYAKVIRKEEARLADGWQMGSGRERRERCRGHAEQQKRLQKMDNVTKIVNEKFNVNDLEFAAKLEEQNSIMAHIDPDIDMTPHPSGHRNYDDLQPIRDSVFHFGLRNDEPNKPSPQERKALPAPFYTEINYDCDQVRALVKRFVTSGLIRMWTFDNFCRVCGLERPQLVEFLENSGPQAGKQSPAYAMCWEFIRRRQELGLPPFFDEKKANRTFPYRKVKLSAKKDGRSKQPKQPTPQQLEKKRKAEEARKKRRPTDAELRERWRAEAESKQQEPQQQQQQEEQQQEQKQSKQQKKRKPDVDCPTRASKRIKAQEAGG